MRNFAKSKMGYMAKYRPAMNMLNTRHFCSKEDDGLTITKEGDTEKVTIDLSKVKGTTLGNSGAYLIMYTWKVCEHRQARTFSKGSYHEGVVLIRCEGCDNLHLIADNLGWFDDNNTNIETIMKEKGDRISKMITDETMEFLDNEVSEKKQHHQSDLNKNELKQ